MMKNFLLSFILLSSLVITIVCTSCAIVDEDDNGTADTTQPFADVTAAEDIESAPIDDIPVDPPYVVTEDQCIALEPPLTENELSAPVPDFLTEQQQMLYRRANSIFVAFRGGYPFKLDDYPTNDNPNNYTLELGECIEVPNEFNIQYYYAATGRYKKWDDFVSMGTSIFTDEYFDELSAHFLNIDGITYLPDVAMGGGIGYLPDRCPDTFTLISKTDTEIRFEVTAYFFDSNHPSEAEQPTEAKTYPITLVLTDNGWRVSLFSMIGY